ncbi:LacI family DNA-binding transcriptional regulator [Kibdelosporangium aridum]|uniref:DNA-binding transcriptional regulator, LacI/PurR family n=1 Tax=Kibdelosporangium aridum TaxID=2030 RepID=A0A1W2F956_KIBAR|nr:LacI family DNA-binding transcriptional regulator [Kibdelosporangium aridum]SMD18158.1 DNA-binding transcriptional regulator, LacI/PurR family [Kibdelosporangium aridum]
MTGAQPPLYQQVKRELLAAIAAGEYSPGKPFVTQREICERFGVSHATAVRALNELAAEGHVVRRRGQGTFVAERKPAPGDQTVACILQYHGPHVSQLLAGVEAGCAEFGYRLYLTHCEGDTAREEHALRQALAHNASGIIIYPAEGSRIEGVYEEVRSHRVPLVMVDRYRPDLATDAVLVDNFGAGHDLTVELIGIGHRVIATLWDETDATSVRDRLAGHLQALREHNIPARPDLTVLRRYRSQPVEQRRAMLRELLNGPQPPTVFLCSNGYALATAAHDLAALGLDIPGDVDLAGMDDAGPFDVLPLTVAAVELPSRELGRRAMRLLHSRVTEGPADPEMIVLPVTVKNRKSAPGHLRVVGAPWEGR